MKEILLTSPVLIAALLVLRKVFQKTISRRAHYTLGGLVGRRLLVPVNLPALHYNVLTAAEPVQTAACRTPGICGHRQLGGRHGYHRRPLPPDDYGGGADCRLVRRYGGHGGLVPLYQPPLCP